MGLKLLTRQYQQAVKVQTMLNNNLLSLLDLSFPGINKLFISHPKEKDDHEKWGDFVLKFPHYENVAKLTPSGFKNKYQRWCKENEYRYTSKKSDEIHSFARECIGTVAVSDAIVFAIEQAASILNSAM